MNHDADLGRLRWRCRRGTRELDLLLGWWLEECRPRADDARRRAFDVLLEQPDPQIWDWLIARVDLEDVSLQPIIDEIRAHHQP